MGGVALFGLDPYVSGMVLLRFLSACTELTGAFLMLRANRVDAALRVNGLLGLVGPTVLIVVTTIGVVGLAQSRVEPSKIILIFMGVYLILLGTR